MGQKFKDSVSKLSNEIIERLREDQSERLDKAAFEERIIGIEKAVISLCEADVHDDKIISLLQKYWDLRFSEAEEFLRYAKQQVK